MSDQVEVYRNVRQRCWSLRSKGRVIGHRDQLYMREPLFRVQEGGRARVVRTKIKNVHAYVKGIICEKPRPFQQYYQVIKPRRIQYNPYMMKHFELDGIRGDLPTPIASSTGIVEFKQDGSLWLIAVA